MPVEIVPPRYDSLGFPAEDGPYADVPESTDDQAIAAAYDHLYITYGNIRNAGEGLDAAICDILGRENLLLIGQQVLRDRTLII